MRLNENGIEIVKTYIRECEAKRKEILDAGLDNGNITTVPTIDDILNDVVSEGFDADGYYCGTFGVTNSYDSDYPLTLNKATDFEEV